MSPPFSRYEALFDAPPLHGRHRVEGLGAYRGFSELMRAMQALSPRAEVEVMGESHEGAPIVRIGLGPKDARAASLVIAGLHAMEWIGVESCLALVDRLLEQKLDRRIELFPLANPDGFRRAERDLLVGRRRFVRTNARGVDLNRNWPTHWKTRLLAPTFFPFLGGPGTHAASEPEVRAILGTLETLVPRCDRALSFHSFGKVLLLPYGGRWAHPPRIDALRREARAVQAQLPDYVIRGSARWLPGLFAYGMEIDHFDALGIDALLVECGAGGLSLTQPASWFHPLRWFNPPDLASERAKIAGALLPFVLG